MRQDSLDYRRVFNTGNDLDLTGAPLAGLDIDVKYPQALPAFETCHLELRPHDLTMIRRLTE
jgi:hypothetical protein